MAIDLAAIKTFLKVNGLSPESPTEEIRRMLVLARYSPGDIATILTLLANQEAMQSPQPAVSPVSDNKTPALQVGTPALKPKTPNEHQNPTINSVPVPLWVQIYGTVTSLILYALLAAYLLIPLRIFEGGFLSLASVFTPSGFLFILPSVACFFIAYSTTRSLNRFPNASFQLSTFLSLYVLLWFGFLMLLQLLFLVSGGFSGIADIMGLIIGSMLQANGVSIVALSLFAPSLLSLTRKNVRPTTHTTIPVVVSLVAVVVLCYFSGVLTYPAQALKLNFLCEGIAGKSARDSCKSLSYTVSASDKYEVIHTSVPLKEFKKIGGHIYMLSETGGGGSYNDIYVDGARDARYKVVRAPILDVAGKPVFEATDVASGKPVIVFGDEEIGGYIGYGSLTVTSDGSLAYVGVKEDRTMVVVSGKRIVGASLGIEAVSPNNGLVPLADGSLLYSFWKKDSGISLGPITYVAVDDTVIGGPYGGVYLFERDGKPGYSYTEGNAWKTIVDGKEVATVERPEGGAGAQNQRLIRKDDGFYLDGKRVAPSENAYSSALIDGKFIIGGVEPSVFRMLRGYGTSGGFIIAEKGLISDELRTALESI